MLRVNVGGSMLIIVNFNEVLKPRERKDGKIMISSIRDFAEWVNDMQLVDPPLIG